MDKEDLKALVTNSLQAQGFRIAGRCLVPPLDPDKAVVRDLHAAAVRHRIDAARKGLARWETSLLKQIASGEDVKPCSIAPRLVEVQPDSFDELLFRYARIHWSIPVSAGYGRRLRFLVKDNSNDKLIGIIGLCDPVFSLAPRDRWIGWSKEQRRNRLHHVMDAFVLGAVPPYSSLLCGKLVAMLAASDEVRKAFWRKYSGRESLISGRNLTGELALVTTTSALGRSSVYNRLRFREHPLYHSVGFTQGSGEFHFSNGLYEAISRFVEEKCEPSAKHERWGTGFRNRREIVRKCLAAAGLPANWICHGIQREVFVIPLAHNARAFLRGEAGDLAYCGYPARDLFGFFRDRWLLPRSERDLRYQQFDRSSYAVWNDGG